MRRRRDRRPERLTPLPRQPDGVPWPTMEWPEWPGGDPELDAGAVASTVERAFDPAGPLALTLAAVVVHRGRLVLERYAGDVVSEGRPPEQVDAGTLLPSWSIAKSVLQLGIGLLARDGTFDPDGIAAVPSWISPDDDRHLITVTDLLRMRDGLDFAEDYIDERGSDAIAMLFGAGHTDVAAYARSRPARVLRDTEFNYSSGSTNILSWLANRAIEAVEPGETLASTLERELFSVIGATSAMPGLDEAGTWVASSFLDMTARDFARIGLFALRDGVWEGAPRLPAGWIDRGRTLHSVDPDNGLPYGEHWWGFADGRGTFGGLGYDGQVLALCPASDTVVVRLGRTPVEREPGLLGWVDDVLACFDPAGSDRAAGAPEALG